MTKTFHESKRKSRADFSRFGGKNVTNRGERTLGPAILVWCWATEGERQGAVTGRFSARLVLQTGRAIENEKNMNTLFKVLAVFSVVGLVLGLSDLGNGMFSGFCRAFGAIFFILAFITKTVDKAEHDVA
jgi:hypothetical protein